MRGTPWAELGVFDMFGVCRVLCRVWCVQSELYRGSRTKGSTRYMTVGEERVDGMHTITGNS